MTDTIRPAEPADAEALTAIYNVFVTGDTCTWQTVPETAETRRAWIMHRDRRKHPALVATDESGRVLGFAALSPYSDRGGFTDLAEVAIYLDASAHGRGLGSRLLRELIDRARVAGLHLLLSRVSGDQTASLALHRKLGFVESGRIPEAGVKFGRRLDLVHLHRFVAE